MDDYGFAPGWSKMNPNNAGGWPKTNRFSSPQPARMYFNQPRGSISNMSVNTVGSKGTGAIAGSGGTGYYEAKFEDTGDTTGYYGGQYAGFPPIVPQSLSTQRGGGGGSSWRTLRSSSRGSGMGRGGGSYGIGTFPKKRRASFGAPLSAFGGGYGMGHAKKEKQYSTSGKTAAMILNELYPDFKDQCTYETLQNDNKTPSFKCAFKVQGKDFEAEGSSKKIAKQLACERALKDLRPDIQLDVPSFEETEASRRAAVAARRTDSDDSMKASPKKKKSDPLKTANSLHDYFLRLCRDKEAETGEKFNPEFSFLEMPVLSPTKQQHIKRFECTLVMMDQGKIYKHEGVGKAAGKNSVIRKALVEVFKVSPAELKSVERRALNLRPGTAMNVLMQALSFYDRTLRIEVDTADEKPPEANSRFVAKITLDDDKTIVGPPEESKQRAKEAACLKVLTEELELSMPSEADVSLKRAATVLSPCYALHHLMLKNNRSVQPDLVYAEAEDVSGAQNKPPQFRCVLTVNGKDTFEGFGQSKKAAKSAAAEKALLELFKFDMNASDAVDLLNVKRSKADDDLIFCNDIATLVRCEYETVCHEQGCPLTTYISAFVLESPEGNRTVVALGAGRNAIINGSLLANARGNVLLHMQSTVLARRAFLVYLHKQVENADSAESIIERSPTSNRFRIKEGYKLILFCSFPPNVTRQASEKQKLSCYNGVGVRTDPAPDVVQSVDEILTVGKLNIMSIADKILKWNYLGVQGALLSYMLEPIFITHMCICSPTNDRAVLNAVLLRFGDSRKSELVVKSSHEAVPQQGEMYHNWIAGIGTLERLDPFTGRTVSGSPSRLCKFELFESWSRLLATVDGVEGRKPKWSCADAKRGEKVYMSALSSFHEQLQALGLGVWQRKDVAIDDFALVSYDE